MTFAQRTQARTRMFARVMGPFLVIITATAVARASNMRTLLTQFQASAVWPWVTGAFILVIGLVVVTLHQDWHGTPAIIVSLVGWLTTLKGFLLMAFPHAYLSMASTAVDAVAWWRTGFVALALIGLYLTFVGWTPAPIRTTRQAPSSAPDAPRTAA